MTFDLFVTVRFQFEALHCWPGAAEHAESYLQHPHRHMFHVEGKRKVTHDDRDVEFIELRRNMLDFAEQRWGRGVFDLKMAPSTASCEQMATTFCEAFDLVSCRVSEDGENGAEAIRTS